MLKIPIRLIKCSCRTFHDPFRDALTSWTFCVDADISALHSLTQPRMCMCSTLGNSLEAVNELL
jgi:hypothetical protein